MLNNFCELPLGSVAKSSIRKMVTLFLIPKYLRDSTCLASPLSHLNHLKSVQKTHNKNTVMTIKKVQVRKSNAIHEENTENAQYKKDIGLPDNIQVYIII